MLGADGVKVLAPKKDLDPRFIYYQLSSFKIPAKGYARHFRFLAERIILVPPLSVQREIVDRLDAAFQLIDRARANVERCVVLAGELWESVLEGEFMNLAVPHLVETMGSVCSLAQGLAINKQSKHLLIKHSELPLLRIKDMRTGIFTQFINPQGVSPNTIANEDSIIYTRTGSLGLVFTGFKGVLHNNSFRVIPSQNVLKEYMIIWLQTPLFYKKVMSLGGKAAQPDISHKLFKTLSIPVPDCLEDQSNIVEKVLVSQQLIEDARIAYQGQLHKPKILQKSVLQEVLEHSRFESSRP